jgi:hypothetical protein
LAIIRLRANGQLTRKTFGALHATLILTAKIADGGETARAVGNVDDKCSSGGGLHRPNHWYEARVGVRFPAGAEIFTGTKTGLRGSDLIE